MNGPLEEEQKEDLPADMLDDSWVQEAVLQEGGPEPFSHSARQGGPQGALGRLRELCRRWLMPKVHTREHMLRVLPRELQAWLQEHLPESSEEATSLVEGLTQSLRGSGEISGHGEKVALMGKWDPFSDLALCSGGIPGLYSGITLGEHGVGGEAI